MLCLKWMLNSGSTCCTKWDSIIHIHGTLQFSEWEENTQYLIFIECSCARHYVKSSVLSWISQLPHFTSVETVFKTKPNIAYPRCVTKSQNQDSNTAKSTLSDHLTLTCSNKIKSPLETECGGAHLQSQN
jgi:hypothetical protein